MVIFDRFGLIEVSPILNSYMYRQTHQLQESKMDVSRLFPILVG